MLLAILVIETIAIVQRGVIMSRRISTRSTPKQNLQIMLKLIPWKLLVAVPIILLIAIPIFSYSAHLGNQVMPFFTNYFYTVFGAAPSATPMPTPIYPSALPQVGSLQYTVQAGDSCDSILAYQMNMASAGQIFSDANPVTVQALSASVGHDCDKLQPGLVLTLSPQYPLVALSGQIVKIDLLTTQQAVPTPLISVTPEATSSVDCSGGCLLAVNIMPKVQVHVAVTTTVPVNNGSLIWMLAAMARKQVANFPDYPYADPNASFNGMTLQACDIQIGTQVDNSTTPCDSLSPSTIDQDGGSWLFGVTGKGGLDHWNNFGLNLPAGTRVLLWLTNNNGTLTFQPGNPVYRYDETSHLYVKA
jgi:hypothetical protein